MAKFTFIMSLVAFLAIGVLCFFFLNVGTVQTDTQTNNSKSYDSFVVKEDFNIRSFLSRLTSHCESGNSECVSIAVLKYIYSDISATDEGLGGKAPKTTFLERKGDQADKAILLASLLENGGINTFIDIKKGSPLVYGCGFDILKLYSEIKEDLHKIPLANRNVILRKGQVWAVDLKTDNNMPIAVDIVATGSELFNMFLFPDKGEAEAYLARKDGRFLSDCSAQDVKSLNISCLSPSGGMLLFISASDNNNFNGAVMKGGVLLNDIKSIEKDGKTCIPMDINIKDGFIYPGFLSYN